MDHRYTLQSLINYQFVLSLADNIRSKHLHLLHLVTDLPLFPHLKEAESAHEGGEVTQSEDDVVL